VPGVWLWVDHESATAANWPDLSGNFRDLVQPTANLQPTVGATSVQFRGDQVMTNENDLPSNVTIYYRARVLSSPASTQTVIGQLGSGYTAIAVDMAYPA
jgi:hypothetical protein